MLLCNICGTLIKGQKALKKHKIIHEPKSQKCDICGMMFHLKERLNMHKREKHATENLYKCKVKGCDKTFRYGSHYRDHVKEHKKVDFTKCGICNKQYASRSSLRSHLHLTHPEKYGFWPSKDPKRKNT